MSRRISAKAESFTESVIREMTRLAIDAGAVNLAQGFPDFACPTEIKEAASAAIYADVNQYAITWGAKPFREAIAAKTARFYPAWIVDPQTQITVTCGATEGMIASMLGILDPGDEVVVFEPFYENYGPDAILSGAVPRYVTLHEPDWSIDPDELRAAFSPRTRAIVVNSPHNPTGKVFRRAELELIAGALPGVRRHRLHRRHLRAHPLRRRAHPAGHDPRHGRPDGQHQLAVEDLFGHRLASRLGDRPARAVGRHSKGPRLPDGRRGGSAAGGRRRSRCRCPTPTTTRSPRATASAATRSCRRSRRPGFRTHVPDGAYYVMTDIDGLTDEDDVTYARRLIRVAGRRGRARLVVLLAPELGRTKIRFAFPKRSRRCAPRPSAWRRSERGSPPDARAGERHRGRPGDGPLAA